MITWSIFSTIFTKDEVFTKDVRARPFVGSTCDWYLRQFLQWCVQYPVILDRVLTALDCNKYAWTPLYIYFSLTYKTRCNRRITVKYFVQNSKTYCTTTLFGTTLRMVRQRPTKRWQIMLLFIVFTYTPLGEAISTQWGMVMHVFVSKLSLFVFRYRLIV